MTFANWIGWVVVLPAILGVARWMWRRSPLIGAFVLGGILIRAIAGSALFWISLRHLPVLPGLQLGNGFWVLALDGVTYYNSARNAVEHGLSTISSAAASAACTRRPW